ncbi:MAG: carboxypeptidase-like regulatory domain-containing protein [Acidobacteriota bacterium]
MGCAAALVCFVFEAIPGEPAQPSAAPVAIELAIKPTDADQETRLTVDLWAMGKVTGVLKAKEKGQALPRTVLVRTLAAPAFAKRLPAPKGAMDCPVDEKGSWTCSLPAAVFDLVISADGFVPHYRWAVEIPAGKERSLGTLELERGASVAGWLAVEEGPIEPGRCTVRLAPWSPGGADPTVAATAEQKAHETIVSPDGFFQLKGLPAGVYVLEARQPGYSPVRIAPLRVALQTETFLEEPLVLRRPLALSIEVSPPLDWLGHPWTARVVREEESGGRPNPVVFEGAVGESGALRVPDQIPGLFRVSILDSLGNGLAASEASLSSAGSPPLRIEVDLVTVEGSVRLGQEPLAADLWFGGRSGAVRVNMASDREGRFHGVLPRGGDWKVEVEASAPRLRTLYRTDVRPNRAGQATVDVALPDTRIFGSVLDEHGKPVPSAEVIFLSERVETLDSSDALGGFELRGLPEGAAWLAASKDGRGSARVDASLAEGRAVGPIQLRFLPMRRLSGRVLSPAGPVPGAQVTVVATVPPVGGGVVLSEPDGSFEIELPEVARRITAVVAAPGYALRAFDTSVDTPVSFPVSRDEGDLEIRLGLATEELTRRDLRVAVYQNGLEILPNTLYEWSRQQGQPWPGSSSGPVSLRIPGLAPGDYRICLVPLRLQEEPTVSSQAECDAGALFANGVLTLQLGKP